jgi:protein O-mannosyl-transferase
VSRKTRKPDKATSVAVAAAPQRLSRTYLVYLLLLVVTTLVTYYPVKNHPFVNYDDDTYVTANSHVQAGLSPSTVAWAFTTFSASNWHPLTWLSHALDSDMFGLDPAGPHMVNVVLHLLNVLVLFWVLEKTTGRPGRSCAVAALFALHPINVETVAWVAERKNLLSMLFLLLALAAYRRYVLQPRVGRYVLVAVLFALGLMAKPQIISLPFLLLLWDYWPLERIAVRQSPVASRQNGAREISGEELIAKIEKRPSGEPRMANGEERLSRLVLEKLPLFAISSASAVITVIAQRSGRAVQSLTEFPFSLRLENAIVSYAHYLTKAVWPSPLVVFYPFSRTSPPAWEFLVSAALLLAVTGLVIVARRHRYLTVGWLWFLGTLVPMIGLVQVGLQAMADRYAYLSFVGLFVMVCWGVADFADARGVSPQVVTGATVALLLVLALVTHHQLGYWQDSISLWSHAAQSTKGNYVAEDNMGVALFELREPEQAMEHFRRALEIDPHNGLGHLGIAGYEQQTHHWPQAIADYQLGISEVSEIEIIARAYNNLGYVYLYSGDPANARDSFQHAVQLSPDLERSWQGLGAAAQNAGDIASAIQFYQRANEARPSSLGYVLLARALERSSRTEEAAAALQTARRLPGFAAAQAQANGLVGH